MSEDEDTIQDSAQSQTSDGRGTILITLRNVHPYTEWLDLTSSSINPPN